ncbi:MAG: hypothetical protein FWD77_01740 [Betaproteobacteria bacterium]|nr:hypothetical protein [Betaproteobacteria bacterium]
MLQKILALFALFRAGNEVADPAKWKSHQITANLLGGVIIAAANVAAVFGHVLPIDQDAANVLAAGVLAVVNVVLTLITSARIGLPPASNTDPADPGADLGSNPASLAGGSASPAPEPQAGTPGASPRPLDTARATGIDTTRLG